MKTSVYILILLVFVACRNKNYQEQKLPEESPVQAEQPKTPEAQDTPDVLIKTENPTDTFYHADRRIICDSSFTVGLEKNLEPLRDSLPKHIQEEIDFLAKESMENAAKDDSLFSGPYVRSLVKHFKTEDIEELFFLVGYSFNDSEYDPGAATLFIYGAYIPSNLLWTEEQSDFIGDISMNLWGVKKVGEKYEIFGESYPYFDGFQQGRFLMVGDRYNWSYTYECIEK